MSEKCKQCGFVGSAGCISCATSEKLSRLTAELAEWKSNFEAMEKAGAEQAKRADENYVELDKERKKRHYAEGKWVMCRKELAKAREALDIARSLIIRHHACHVVQRAGAFCPVCHRDDGTEPEMDQIYDALKEAADGKE